MYHILTLSIVFRRNQEKSICSFRSDISAMEMEETKEDEWQNREKCSRLVDLFIFMVTNVSCSRTDKYQNGGYGTYADCDCERLIIVYYE